MTQRVFKMFFSPDDIRRISLPVGSWTEFTQILETIYNSNFFCEKNLQYMDEEGDKCTLSCETEFSAMLESFSPATVIRLHVVEGKNPHFRDSNKQKGIVENKKEEATKSPTFSSSQSGGNEDLLGIINRYLNNLQLGGFPKVPELDEKHLPVCEEEKVPVVKEQEVPMSKEEEVPLVKVEEVPLIKTEEEREILVEIPVFKMEPESCSGEDFVSKEEVPVVDKVEAPVIKEEKSIEEEEEEFHLVKADSEEKEDSKEEEEFHIVKEEEAPSPVVEEIVSPYPAKLSAMVEMGFDRSKSNTMLNVMNGDLPRAIEAMFSI